MHIKRLDSSYKEKVIEVFKICFDYTEKEDALYLEDESIWDFIWGMEEKGQLLATYMSIPTKTKIRGKVFNGHYVDGVATMPFARKGGLARRLFLNDAKECIRNGVEILLLDPFKHDFYRQMGFEVAFDNNDLRFDFELLSKPKDTKLNIINSPLYGNERLRPYIERALKKSWEISRYSEAVDIAAYENALYLNKNLKAAVVVDQADTIRGYMIYSTKDRVMKVPRFWFEDLSGLGALRVFLYRHREQIDTFHMTRIPPDFPIDLVLHSAWQGGSRMQFWDRPSRMLRILDTARCLEKSIRSDCSERVVMRIIDPVIKTNSTVLEFSGGRAVVSQKKEDLSVSVSDLAPLLTGRFDAISLWRMGKIKVSGSTNIHWHTPHVPEAVQVLYKLLPPMPTHSAR